MEMKKLKVATSRMAGYTGVLGPVRFKDGVSEEYLPRHIRDRMAASMEFLELDADGNETPAGAQYRLLTDTQERAPKVEELTRQTEEEKAAELAASAIQNATTLPELETRASLEATAEKGGIKGLREIGKKWGVKHRSIPTLIEMILDAQEKSVAAREKRLAEKVEAERANDPVPAAVVEGETQTDAAPETDEEGHAPAAAEDAAKAEIAEFLAEQERIKAAAASGNLAAAITDQE